MLSRAFTLWSDVREDRQPRSLVNIPGKLLQPSRVLTVIRMARQAGLVQPGHQRLLALLSLEPWYIGLMS